VNLASYEKKEMNLCLVSVNGTPIPDAPYIQQELNKIYAPAIASWTVTSLTGGLTVALSASDPQVLDNTDADDNMNLTVEEKLVASAMKKQTGYNSDTYYLFFFDSGKDDSMNGYMPFKSHFGFIFKNKQNPDELVRTIAHEAAHGPFRLRHTFSPENKFFQTQGATSNLMDYVSSDKALTARNFYKYQWDYVHDPETMWFVSWEDEAEAAITANNLYQLLWTDFNLQSQSEEPVPLTFLTPSGLPFTIKNIVSKFLICNSESGYIYLNNTGSVLENLDNSDKQRSIYLTKSSPAIFGFILKKDGLEEKYYATFGDEFYGYYNPDTKTYLTDEYTYDISKDQSYDVMYWTEGKVAKPEIQWKFERACIIPQDYISITGNKYNKNGYQAAGVFDEDPINTLKGACFTSDALAVANEATWMDWASAGYKMRYMEGGYLFEWKFEDAYEPVYFFCRYDNLAQKNRYFIYENKQWKIFETPKFSDAPFTNLYQFCAKIPSHQTLDILGNIPVVEYAANSLNGIWYLIEGNGTDATLCCAALVIPVAGSSIAKGFKYTVRIIKDLKTIETSYELTYEAYSALARIQRLLIDGDKVALNGCLEVLPKILSQLPDYASTVEKLAGAIGEPVKLEKILSKIDALEIEKQTAFLADLAKNTDDAGSLAANMSKIDEGIVDSWKVLENRPKLKLKIDALESVSNLLKNPSRTKLGLTDEVISNIKASKLDDGSFKAIIDDLDAFGKKLVNKSDIEFENFNSLFGKLTDNNTQNSQAAQWIIQDITNNTDDFVGKKWKFEASVTNSDGNIAFIDAASSEIPPMRIEYKWLTSSTVSKDEFIREFIKRDLFNATDLSKLQWRIKGQKLTKDKALEYLTSNEGKEALNKFSKQQKELLFKNYDELEGITDKNVQDFLNSNFEKIFK